MDNYKRTSLNRILGEWEFIGHNRNRKMEKYFKNFTKGIGKVMRHFFIFRGKIPFITHKRREFEFFYDENTDRRMNFQTGISKKTDHAGLYFTVELAGLVLNFNIYDERHWNKKKDAWETEEDEREMNELFNPKKKLKKKTKRIANRNKKRVRS